MSEAPASAPASKQFDAVEWAARDYPTRAIWALVLSCAGIFAPLVGIAGLVLGWSALKRIDREGRRGRRIALAAIVLGAVDLIVLVLGLLFLTSLLLNR